METIRVTEPPEVREFINFPYDLYDDREENHSLWVPTMKAEVKSALDRDEHPFYRDPDSEARPFLAKNGDEVKGRIMVLKSGPYNRANNENTAFFYFFEAVDSQEVADDLFTAAFSWARHQGLEKLIGPMGMLAGDGHGVLVQGFKRRPGMGMAWNPPYYRKLIEAAGLEKLGDSASARALLDFEQKKEKVQRLYKVAERVRRTRDLRVKSFESKREVREQMDWLVDQISNLYNRSFQGLPFYHPMDREKSRRIINRLLSVTDSRSIRLIKLAIKDERVVGFLLAYPNIASGLRKAGGSLWPLGWLYLSLDRRFTRWADANGIGILPEFQGRGVSTLMYAEFLKSLEASNFEHLIINQISEKNHKNLREIQKTFGVEFDRKHRIYSYEL